MADEFAGKVALVTGAASGIGAGPLRDCLLVVAPVSSLLTSVWKKASR